MAKVCGEQPASTTETGYFSYEVGLAKVDVTPEYPIRLCGFSFRQKESVGVRQRIYARAMAVRGSGAPAVLVTVDSIGIPLKLRREVARRLQAKRKLASERIAICSTHSHTAPCLTDVLPTMFGAPVPRKHQMRIDQYTRELTDRIEQAALAALDDLQPSRLSFTIGKVGFAINRRTRGGPVDHDLPLLIITTPDGKLRGLWTSYACHCVVLSDYNVSGDWAGYASEALEKAYPQTVALVSIGCGADANPESGVTGDKGEVARQYGAQIAMEVDRVLRSTTTPVRGNLKCDLESIVLPLESLPSREAWEQQAKEEGIDGYYARYQLARLDRGEKLPTEISYSIQSWRFGDSLAIVFLPGEVVVDYSLRLKKEYDPQRLWVNAYANDLPAYIPSERILKEGGYEAGVAMHFYGLPAWFAPGLEEKIISTVIGQLSEAVKNDRGRGTRSIPARTPQESLELMKVRDGLRVELVASEPMIRDPVAIDFGPDGKLWVAEMRDYGCKDGEDCPPMGRITVLEDHDSDGQFETSTTFLDQISSPMGVSVWRNGVLICAAPDILYAEDTTGDGKADIVEKLFSGFGTEHPQARVNGFAYGLDGWLYAACSFGGTIHNHSRNEDILHPDSDFRLRPGDWTIEPETGRTQQGRVRDDWGNWFGCNNSVLCWHYPLSERYLSRNPNVLPPTLSVPVANSSAKALFPRGDLVLWELSGPPARPTAACGIGVYRDELLGSDYANNVFTCEPVNQLVHRMVLQPAGATFVGERPADEANAEFLSSTDNWFRPVQARTGPDGALWIVDMYRFVIEHSRWIPEDMHDELDMGAGTSLGRIYRVLPWNAERRSFPRLDTLETTELVVAMDSANGWQRDMVQQMLIWRGDGSAAERLAQLATESKRPATRLQALCTLDALGKLQNDDIERAMSDSHAAVRQHAVRLAETRFTAAPNLLEAAIELVEDPDAFVALQLACSLGEVKDSVIVTSALVDIAQRHAEDPYVVAAVLTSMPVSDATKLVQNEISGQLNQVSVLLLAKLVELATTAGTSDEVDDMLGAVAHFLEACQSDRRFSVLTGFLTGISRNRQLREGHFASESHDRLRGLIDQCLNTLSMESVRPTTRIDCIQAIGRAPTLTRRQLRVLGGFLSAEHESALQIAALDALALQNQEEIARELLQQWPGLTPSLRMRVLDVLLSRKPWVGALLDAVQAKQIPLGNIDASHRYRLSTYADPEIRRRATELLRGSSGERSAIVAHYLKSLPLGEAARGKAIFEKQCAACHQFQGIGNQVGPDIATSKDKSDEAMVREILDPNRAIDQRYLEYMAITTDGRVKSGILIEESSNSITLLGQEGQRVPLLRSELESLNSSGRSLMPEGFENQISLQEMADLIQFLSAR